MHETRIVIEPGKQETVMESLFDAPPERLFKAFTEPDLIVQWWGPQIYTTTVDRLEAKPGGIWRFVQHDSQGHEYAFHGVFHAVVPPECLVYTFEFEGEPGHVLLETVVFEENNGKTRLIDTTVFQSVADRDAMVAAGMESGAVESMLRLADLLKRL